MLLLTRNGFLNHYPMKPFVICQPVSKFDMFSFVVSHIKCSISFFSGRQKGDNFQREGWGNWNETMVLM